MAGSPVQELDSKQLRSSIDSSQFSFKSTEEIESLEGVIGQERAVRALEFGLDVDDNSYNIFVTGLSATGKTTIVKKILENRSADEQVPDDWLMVNNFDDQFIRLSSAYFLGFLIYINFEVTLFANTVLIGII